MPSIMDQRTLPNINTGTPLNLPSVSANVVGAQTGNIPYNQLTIQKLRYTFRQRLKNHDTQDDTRTYYKFAWSRNWFKEGYCKYQNQSPEAYEQ